ncbi:MAG: GNAT family N-acetyltransferase [Pseudomonadota bacterium]
MTPKRARLWHLPRLLSILWSHKRAVLWTDLRIMAKVTVRGWVQVVQDRHGPAGFILRDDTIVHALYIHPRAQGHGLGRVLLQDAKRRTDRLDLWVAQANKAARRFYLRHGFAEKTRTGGENNDPTQPDILMVWPPERRVEP